MLFFSETEREQQRIGVGMYICEAEVNVMCVRL